MKKKQYQYWRTKENNIWMMPSPSKDPQTCCTHIDNTGQTYNFRLPPVTLAYEDSVHTVCLIARTEVLRVNFANGGFVTMPAAVSNPAEVFRLASLARARVSSSDFKPKWQLLGHERHLLVQFLGFDFVLLSRADATWWNAVVVVLTCRKMNSHETTKQNFPFPFRGPCMFPLHHLTMGVACLMNSIMFIQQKKKKKMAQKKMKHTLLKCIVIKQTDYQVYVVKSFDSIGRKVEFKASGLIKVPHWLLNNRNARPLSTIFVSWRKNIQILATLIIRSAPDIKWPPSN